MRLSNMISIPRFLVMRRVIDALSPSFTKIIRAIEEENDFKFSSLWSKSMKGQGASDTSRSGREDRPRGGGESRTSAESSSIVH